MGQWSDKHTKDNCDIVNENLALIDDCVNYQFAKVKDECVRQLKDDFRQDLILTLYDYDNAKLNDAYQNNHLNALITRIILNNIYSSTSQLYTTYRKFLSKTGEITHKIEDTYGEDGIQ